MSLSQTLLAIPMWGLWEIGLFFARFYVKKEDEQDQEQPEEGAEALPLSCPRSRRMVRPHRVDGFQIPDMHLFCPEPMSP